MTDVFFHHEVGEVFGGVWHVTQLPDHCCCLCQPWETEPSGVTSAVFCVVPTKSFDPLPECEQGFAAVAIPIWISASEYTIVSATSPRVVIILRSRGNRKWYG